MLLDALTNASNAASLTAIAAGATGYSNVIDINTARDLGPQNMPVVVVATTLPTSATGGATLNVALQGSTDGTNFTTLEETAPQPIANANANNPFLFRGTVPANGPNRYFRFAYTPSAVLTAGAVTASIGADWPRHVAYPKNFT